MASKAEVEGRCLADDRADAAADRAEQYIKVRAGQIDYLVDMIGELIIAEGQLDASAPPWPNSRKISREVRSAPSRTTDLKSLRWCWRACAHLARLGKAVSFDDGRDVEVDRGRRGLSGHHAHITQRCTPRH